MSTRQNQPSPCKLDADIRAAIEARGSGHIDVLRAFRALDMHAIVRADLELTPGQLAIQCAHAFQLALEQARERAPDIEQRMKDASKGYGFKDCRSVATLGQLLGVYRSARAADVPCALVIESGWVRLPHFDGSPVITAVGIGPAWRDTLASLVGRLPHIV